MKKLAILVLLLGLLPGLGHAAGYVVGTYAFGGDMGEVSGGIEVGGIFLSDLHPAGGALSLGVGISVGDTDESPPSTLLPAAPGAITGLLEFNDGNEQQVYACGGAELTPGLFAVAGLGYASQDMVTIAFTSGGWYQVSSEHETHLPWMLGVRYAVQGLVLGLGYDARRGASAYLGIAF